MTSAATFDAGPLSWVKGEIDLALERVAQGLQQFGANTADLTQIKFCRTHLHQVRGALTIVGLDGLTQFTDSVEALLSELEAGRQPSDAPRIALIGRAVASIRRYLDDLIAGDPNQPLRLVDLYRQIAAARGLPAPSASELFFPDLTNRPQLPNLTLAADGPAQLKVARARYQKGLLAFIKAPDTPIGALELKLAAQMAASADASPALRGFWWVAGGFFAALAEKSITADAETKSLCTRIDQQLRQQTEGGRAVPEKLMRDALYQVAIARSKNPEVLAIKEGYELTALIPSGDNKAVSLAAQIEPFLKRMKEIATASEEAWNKFCTGNNQALQTFCDAAAALDQGAERLANTDFRRLIRAVGSTANWIKEDRKRLSDPIALEVATGILLIGNGVDNFTRLGPDYVHQVDLMVARLHACIAGSPLPRDAEVPVLDEMTRRAQEKLLIAQVVKEIHSSLGQIEQALDTFFREPDQKEQLAGCQKPISQIIGALSILGHMDAVAQLQDSARQITQFRADGYQPEQKDFERVARQLSALGFFVDALPSGVTDYRAFVANLEVKPSKVEVAAEQAANAVAAEAAAPVVEPTPSTPPAEISLKATPAITLAEPVAETTRSESPALPLVDAAPEGMAPVETPAAAPAAAAPAAAPAADQPEIDAELLEIFLEEANEVIGTIGEQLDILRGRPSDVEALTTLRRAFHTLKGSSRMVGLMAFGDVAWIIEQVHNLWLRQEKPVDATLISLVENSRQVFGAWIGHLEGNGEPLPDVTELVAQGDKLKGGETITAPGRPLPSSENVAPAAESLTAEAPAADETESEATATADGSEELSFDLDLPAFEIAEPFAAAAEPLQELSLAPEQDAGLVESPPEALPDAGVDFDLELAPEAETNPAEIRFDQDLPIGEHEPEASATAEAERAEDTMPIADDEVPAIELTSLLAPPTDDAGIGEAEVEIVSFDLDGDAAPSTEAPASALEIEVNDDVAAIDLISLIEPPNEEMPALDLSNMIGVMDSVTAESPMTEAAPSTESGEAIDLGEAVPETGLAGEPTPAGAAELDVAFGEAGGETEPEPSEPSEPAEETSADRAPAHLPETQTITVAPTLQQIFLEEAHAHVKTLQRYFGELEILPDAPTPNEMLRAAHTIGSISGTVGYPSALKVGHAIEAALLRREKAANPASLEALETLRIAIAEIEMMVAAIERNEPLGNPSALVSQLGELYPCAAAETIEAAASTLASLRQASEPAAPTIDEPLPDDQIDESLLPIFQEEAVDLVAGINERLSMWAGNPYDTDTIHALTRLLHTLKGSARMSGAMRIGALAHRLESSVESAHRAGGADPVLIAALQADFDDIAELADNLGKTSAPVAASEVTDATAAEVIEPMVMIEAATEVAEAGSSPDIATPPEVVPEASSEPEVTPAADADLPAESAAIELDFDLGGSSEAGAGETEFASIGEPLATDGMLPIEAPVAEIITEAPDSQPALESDFAPVGSETTASEIALDFDFAAPAIDLPDLQEIPADAAFAPDTAPALALAETAGEPVVEPVFAPFTEAPVVQLAAPSDDFSAPSFADAPMVSAPDFAPAPDSTETEAEAAAIPEDHLDPDLLPIFLEEAVEIVRTVYEQLDAWQAAPADGAASHGLARSLHTLKGSARMAGAMSLGALTHTLESRAEEAAKSGQASVSLIEEMKLAFDVIAQVVERLQRGESLSTITIELPEPGHAAEAPAFSVSASVIAPVVETVVEPPAPVSKMVPSAPAKPLAAVVAPAAPAAVAAAVAAQRKDSDVAKPMLRVRAELIDGLVNDAGELSIARARIEGEMRSLKQSLLDLTENVIRLRRQLREIEIQAESQMQSRTAASPDGKADFDPLELDRFTRFQEVTRMMAESVNDVATVQLNLLKNLDEANAGLAAQGRLNRELQQALMSVRMVPFASITERLSRIVRQTAKELGKKADLEIQGAGIELDQNVINKMIGPLEHLLRNAISHGVELPALRVEQGKDEMGDIRLSLRQEGNEVIITMRDDGAGLNFSRIREKAIAKGLMTVDDPYDERKLTEMIFNSGFSTAEQVSQIAGRGVGMDVVMTEVTNLGGRIDVTSESGKGSVFRIYLPLTLAVTNAVIVRIGTQFYAIPSSMVDQVQEIREEPLAKLRDAGGADWMGNHYPFHFLPHLLGEPNALPEARRMYWVMYLHSGLQRVAVQVDELQSTHEIVVKNIGPQLSRVVGIAGATVMGDGRVILILNPVALAARAPLAAPVPELTLPVFDDAGNVVEAAAVAPAPPPEPEKIARLPTVLVVDDSLTVRKITNRLLAREGYQVFTAKDGQDALEQMVELIPDVILSDIEMPRMDGFELARNIRADQRLSSIPIIMISSRTADKHRSHAAELGVKHFLGKPYQEEELLGLIAQFIAEQRAA